MPQRPPCAPPDPEGYVKMQNQYRLGIFAGGTLTDFILA
jgi:hypothetical protein